MECGRAAGWFRGCRLGDAVWGHPPELQRLKHRHAHRHTRSPDPSPPMMRASQAGSQGAPVYGLLVGGGLAGGLVQAVHAQHGDLGGAVEALPHLGLGAAVRVDLQGVVCAKG
jgi:hypothetical protein